MDTREAGRLGAAKTNKILTTESRRKAALKGWKNHNERELSKEKSLSKSKKK